MGILRYIGLSVVVLLAGLPVECRSASTGGPASSSSAGLACANLDDHALEECVGRHGKAEGDRLAPRYAELDKALGTACFDLPEPTIGDCLTKAQAIADQALERALRAAMAAIDESAETPTEASIWKGRLKEAQKRWAEFRDADCDKLIASEYMGGTGAGPAGGQCTLGKTLSRVMEIRSRYVER